jgi:hypothetical protein
MSCDPALLEELKHLVSKQHCWRRNSLRTNLAHSKDDIVVDGTWRKLKVGVFSNGVREGQTPAGDRMLAIVREMLPNATVNALQLNRNVVCGKHKDARNSASESHILFFGHYSGGALVFETGERFEERDVWHGPMQSRDYYHWNEEILPVPGSDLPFCKYAVVAYAHEGSRLFPRRPRTRWARVLNALRRVFDCCKRRYTKWQSDKLR